LPPRAAQAHQPGKGGQAERGRLGDGGGDDALKDAGEPMHVGQRGQAEAVAQEVFLARAADMASQLRFETAVVDFAASSSPAERRGRPTAGAAQRSNVI
jgi:hypothetical protein